MFASQRRIFRKGCRANKQVLATRIICLSILYRYRTGYALHKAKAHERQDKNDPFYPNAGLPSEEFPHPQHWCRVILAVHLLICEAYLRWCHIKTECSFWIAIRCLCSGKKMCKTLERCCTPAWGFHETQYPTSYDKVLLWDADAL